MIGISFVLALASCAHEVDDLRSPAETFAQAQDVPVVSSIFIGSSPARGDTYELGETVVVFVQFDGPVETTDHGGFQMALTIGAETQYATLVGWRSDHRYRFEYTVQEPDRDEDGISIPANAIVLNGGTITAPDGTTDADLTHETVPADAGRKMNGSLTSPPAVTSIDFVSAPAKGNAYERGEDVKVVVEFDRVVTVSGNPQVALTIGTETRHADHSVWWQDHYYLFFSYKVQGDDRDEDGISIPANALILNGGTITATDGTTDADLTHAPVGPERDRKVDGSSDVTPPRVKAVSFDTSPARGDTYELGETVVVLVEFDGPVERTGDLQVALTIGTETRYATLFSETIGRHMYYFEHTVQERDRDDDGISTPANALILNSGAVTDPSGTVDADLTHGTVAADAGRKVNGSLASPPAVKRVYLFSSPPTKGDIYGPGETVRVGVEFDRVVTVTGNPQVALTIGTQTRYATPSTRWDDDRYVDFSYVVQEGDRDEDGISIPANALTLNGGTIKLAADSTIDADLTHAAVARDPTRKVSGSRASP